MTPRQARFARLVSEGADPVAAVAEAGYSAGSAGTARRTAARLLRAPDTQLAVSEAMAGKTEALEQLEAARQLAMKTGDAHAAVLAVRSIARIRGVV